MWNRLTCVTPSSPIVTLAKAKANSRVDFTDHDDLITDLIAQAQATIEGPKGIGRALGPSIWRLSLDRWPHHRRPIEIPLGPVTSIVTIDYVDADGAPQTLDPSLYLVDLDRDPVRIAPAYGQSFPIARDQIGAIKIKFEAGPEEPEADMQRAIILLVSHWYENPETTGLSNLVELPHGVRAILGRLGPGAV